VPFSSPGLQSGAACDKVAPGLKAKMGRHNIKDLTLGQSLRELYLVKSKRKSTTQRGTSYLDLELQDKTGIIKAKVWDDAGRRRMPAGRRDQGGGRGGGV
jgi:hypothetical protein